MGAEGFREADWIWKDGEYIRWADAQVHLLASAVQFGSSIFEGIAWRGCSDMGRN